METLATVGRNYKTLASTDAFRSLRRRGYGLFPEACRVEGHQLNWVEYTLRNNSLDFPQRSYERVRPKNTWRGTVVEGARRQEEGYRKIMWGVCRLIPSGEKDLSLESEGVSESCSHHKSSLSFSLMETRQSWNGNKKETDACKLATGMDKY